MLIAGVEINLPYGFPVREFFGPALRAFGSILFINEASVFQDASYLPKWRSLGVTKRRELGHVVYYYEGEEIFRRQIDGP